MVERQEVEALLAACVPGSEAFVPAMDEMTRRKMRALCRAWLALDSGIYVTLSRNDVDAMALPDSWSGQLVRIVKEARET